MSPHKHTTAVKEPFGRVLQLISLKVTTIIRNLKMIAEQKTFAPFVVVKKKLSNRKIETIRVVHEKIHLSLG